LVAHKDVLGILEQSGPLSSDAVARRLRLNRLDARLVLVDAHAHGLVRTNSRGDWAITDRGHDALTEGLEDDGRFGRQDDARGVAPYSQRLREFGAGSRWRQVLDPRYLARRGVPLALGAIVCAGGVAVASSRLEGSAGPPVVANTNVKSAPHVRHAHARETRHLTGSATIALRRHRRSTLVSTTGQNRHLRGHFVRQSPRSGLSRCHQRPSTTRTARGCTAGRRGHPHSTATGAGTSSIQRAPHNTGSGGSTAGFTVPPTSGA
jgi:hypothetical protein